MPKITIEIRDKKLIAPFQSEIEALALEILDTHHNIYFTPIPLTDRFDLIWSNKYSGWVLRYLLET